MKQLITATLICILCISCKKSETTDDITPSQSGKNIAVFMIGDEYHIYNSVMEPLGTPEARYNFNDLDTLNPTISFFMASAKYTDQLYLIIDRKNPMTGIPYKVHDVLNDSSYYTPNFLQNSRFVLADTNSSYVIFTRYDSSVIAGKFEFVGKWNGVPEAQVHITEGWFDFSRKE